MGFGQAALCGAPLSEYHIHGQKVPKIMSKSFQFLHSCLTKEQRVLHEDVSVSWSEVAEAFDAVVEQRVSQGLTVEAEFIGIREMKLMEASYSSKTKTAEISVSFVGEMTSVVKNSSGEIVEGDSKQIKRQKDIWTFSKDIKSSSPNWLLVATGE